MSDQPSSSAKLKQFLSEEQIEVERQRRQADWERVRSAADPIEAPAEVFDSRSLYEKLKSQHDAKKEEFENMWAAKNSIRGLDEDETTFLARIDQAKIDKNPQKEFETTTANTRSTSAKPHVAQPPAVNKQKQLLTGIVKRKGVTNESLKRPLEDDDDDNEDKEKQTILQPPARLPRLLIPGGRLPGIGPTDGFSDSSDSNESSDDDGLSRYSSGVGIQSIAQRKKLAKQLQDLAAESTGGCE
ncbi:unnamed protein product [Adineta steineri]|uniref:FAM192A/Fyv6 N-terminal domain-containing protein n=1 Tax=Adineta steineri TaxID=433720 RepID=A0A815DL64_9BILA|nr:unnamed protein product [Adineta steineri]CAF3765861.1 unnamed protein product [Adineta steineri]